MDQMKDVDAIIVPVGGGGLISGVAFAVKSLNPNIKVYGVQAAGAPSMVNSLSHKKIERLSSVSTIADGIAVKEPGQNTFDLCSKYIDDIVTVTDDEVAAAILSMMERQKLVAEGAGAVSVAAAMFNKVPIKGKNVICVVSGGNIDVNFLDRVVKRGLARSGRSCMLTVELTDKPGQLLTISRIISEHGANIIAVHHERANSAMNINGCFLRVYMETRNFEHLEKIKSAIKNEGFNICDLM
jgi:threonine dehydratase